MRQVINFFKKKFKITRIPPKIMAQMNLGSNGLSAPELDVLFNKMHPIKNWISDTDDYIKKNELDPEIFTAQWGEHTQKLVAHAILSKDKEVIDRLRFVWWFSGWPMNFYTNLKTFPIHDPTYIRYQKLKAITPERFRYTAPSILGEAGWREESGIVNHDVAILQERIQFLYFSGVMDYLDTQNNNMILELGSGYGGMSLAFHKSFPKSRHVLTDIPQSLIVAFSYLNIAHPNAVHIAVTANGIYKVGNTSQIMTPEEAFNTPGAFIYLPNYLFATYEKYLDPSLVFNAMSLHEMHTKTIEYYCTSVSKLLIKTNGIFCEVNTLPGLPNVAIDGRLQTTFKHCVEVDLPSLACRPRLWLNSLDTTNKISACKDRFEKIYPLKELFEFDSVVEFPFVKDSTMRKMILKQLGKYLGKTASILPPKGEPFMGNHLRYIVQRRKGI